MSLHETVSHQSSASRWYKIHTGCVLRTQVLEILEVSRQTKRAVLSCCVLPTQVLVYERGGVHHEQGVSAKHHVLRQRPKR